MLDKKKPCKFCGRQVFGADNAPARYDDVRGKYPHGKRCEKFRVFMMELRLHDRARR
jgi:hypothetical protein